MHLLIVIGTRPNFIKVTQFRKVMEARGWGKLTLVHTGQHYDRAMSEVFFDQFNLRPDHVLHLHHGSAGMQFAHMVQQLVTLMEQEQPDFVLVPGDVNSTLAGALAAQRLGIPVGHLEAGLRSFDRTMPEEINRVLVDQLCSHHFITEASGLHHLEEEGLVFDSAKSNLHMVGNTMIDTLVHFAPQIAASSILEDLGLHEGDSFHLITMHRPATVDQREGCQFIVDLLQALKTRGAVVFPIHPRTQKNMEAFGLGEALDKSGCLMTPPLDYFAFQKLISSARAIVTDSGGIQEESTFQGVPCVTLRPNTERPITLDMGTNQLLGAFDVDQVMHALDTPRFGQIPPKWDGKATERVIDVLQGLHVRA